jgi:hypothetical protein
VILALALFVASRSACLGQAPAPAPRQVQVDLVVFERLGCTGPRKVLAEPRLVTLEGRPCSFLSGGEMPLPGTRGEVFFQEFGFRLNLIVTGPKDCRALLTGEVESIRLLPDGDKVPGRVHKESVPLPARVQMDRPFRVEVNAGAGKVQVAEVTLHLLPDEK